MWLNTAITAIRKSNHRVVMCCLQGTQAHWDCAAALPYGRSQPCSKGDVGMSLRTAKLWPGSLSAVAEWEAVYQRTCKNCVLFHTLYFFVWSITGGLYIHMGGYLSALWLLKGVYRFKKPLPTDPPQPLGQGCGKEALVLINMETRCFAKGYPLSWYGLRRTHACLTPFLANQAVCLIFGGH